MFLAFMTYLHVANVNQIPTSIELYCELVLKTARRTEIAFMKRTADSMRYGRNSQLLAQLMTKSHLETIYLNASVVFPIEDSVTSRITRLLTQTLGANLSAELQRQDHQCLEEQFFHFNFLKL